MTTISIELGWSVVVPFIVLAADGVTADPAYVVLPSVFPDSVRVSLVADPAGGPSRSFRAEPFAYSADGGPIDVDMIMAVAHATQAAKEVRMPRPEPRRRYAAPGREFDIRGVMAERHPGVRADSGGSKSALRWDIGLHCPWKHEHTSSDVANSTTVFLYASGAWEFVCKHSHCHGRNHEDFRRYQDRALGARRSPCHRCDEPARRAGALR